MKLYFAYALLIIGLVVTLSFIDKLAEKKENFPNIWRIRALLFILFIFLGVPLVNFLFQK